MAFPVDNLEHDLTGSFGPRDIIYKDGRPISAPFHYGMDFAPEIRGTFTTAHAVKAGTVLEVGTRRDAGRFVILWIPSWGVWVRYCHLSSYTVHAGQVVQEAQFIGRLGSTGNSTGVHLHFEVYTDRGLTTRVNPYKYIWFEPNPADFAINGGKEILPAPPKLDVTVPAPLPAPAPVPQPTKDAVTLGRIVRLSRWTGFNTSDLRGRQRTLLNGDFTVVGISHRHDSFKIRGNGREAWVDGSAAEGLQPVAAAPAPSPAPAPAPAPSRSGLGTMKLAEARSAYRTWQAAKARKPVWKQVAAGTYNVTGLVQGQYHIEGNGYDVWVSDGARSGYKA
jgi:hypothetical protein